MVLPGPAGWWEAHPESEIALRQNLPDAFLAADAYKLMIGPKNEARERYGRVRDMDFEQLVMVPIAEQKTDVMGNLIDEMDIVQYGQDVKTIVLGEDVDSEDMAGDDCEDGTLSDNEESDAEDALFVVIEEEGVNEE